MLRGQIERFGQSNDTWKQWRDTHSSCDCKVAQVYRCGHAVAVCSAVAVAVCCGCVLCAVTVAVAIAVAVVVCCVLWLCAVARLCVLWLWLCL